MSSFLLLTTLWSLQGAQYPDEQLLLDQLRPAMKAGNAQVVARFFEYSEDFGAVAAMANRRGGMRNLDVQAVAIPSDRRTGPSVWFVISAAQDIQSDHDMVFPVIRTGHGFRLAHEVPEWQPDAYRIAHADIDSRVDYQAASVEVDTTLSLTASPRAGSAVFRLGLPYRLEKAWIDGREAFVIESDPAKVGSASSPFSVYKAGGLIVANSPGPIEKVRFRYRAILPSSSEEDKISPKAAYVTAWWTPSIGRLPFTTRTRITGPSDWVLLSEGEPIEAIALGERRLPANANEQTVAYKCDIPISFPKIVAGKYKLAAQREVAGRVYSSYQFEPIDDARAKKDIDLIESSIRWYEANLGPFPFKRYACVDADTYYGIESYSYTLLRRDITTRFVTHEIGHTYFGGLVPCTYTKDSFNESFTQYVDSVLFGGNADKTLEAGLRTVGIRIPLSTMSIAHVNGSASYYRGAYVLNMLEHEIGREAVLAALKELVATRRGLETTWMNVRPSFEKASGKDLKQFWDQWVAGSDFPTLEITNANIIIREGKPSVFISVRQVGEKYLRHKFKIVLSRPGQKWVKTFELAGNQNTFRFDVPEVPTEAAIDVFPLTLANTGPPFKLPKP